MCLFYISFYSCPNINLLDKTQFIDKFPYCFIIWLGLIDELT